LQGMALAIVAAYLFGVLTADSVRLLVWPLVHGSDIELVNQAYDLIRAHYVDKDAVDSHSQEMAQQAIRAMLDTLGDRGHTQFLTKSDLQLQRASLEGRFGGIGAEIAVRDERPVIVAPMDGSPAQQAGIRPGDVILSVEGQDTAKVPLEQIILKVRGPQGTPVQLTIQHADEEPPVELTIVREEIRLRAVTSRYFEDEGILHIRLSQFSAGAAEAIRNAVAEA